MKRDRRLRILIVNRALPEHVAGGLERHVADLALGLAGHGCEVHVLAAPISAGGSRTADDPSKQHLPSGILNSGGRIEFHAARCARADRYTLRYLLGIGREIESVLAERKFDLIHAHEFALGFWRPKTPAPPGERMPALVVSVHGTLTSETPLHPDVYEQLGSRERRAAWRRYGRRLLYAPAWFRTLKSANRILVDSAFTKGELTDRHGLDEERIRLIALGARPPENPPERAAARAALGWEGTQLLTVGRVEWAKGHELALRALAGLKGSAWQYTIAGSGSYETTIRELIAKLGLGDRVTMAGRVSEGRKWEMLAGADLFLWPERTHPAFGLAGLEAMQVDTPVLATPRGAIPELMACQGNPETWLAEGCTAEALGSRLAPLLAEPRRLAEARAGLGAIARARFGFEAMLDGTIGVYEELTAG